MMVTVLANFVRKVASSIAESPPPTTIIFLSRKKNPSQVAQVDSPCPKSSRSEGRPNVRADAPEATINASHSSVSFPTVNLKGRWLRSTLSNRALIEIALQIAPPASAHFR